MRLSATEEDISSSDTAKITVEVEFDIIESSGLVGDTYEVQMQGDGSSATGNRVGIIGGKNETVLRDTESGSTDMEK